MPSLATLPRSIALMLCSNILLSAQEASLMDQTHHDILATVMTMTDAFHRHDLAAITATYEPLAAVAFEPGTPITDPTTREAIFRGFFVLNPHFTYGGHEVIVAGDLALHIAPWTMTAQDATGNPIEQTGLSVAVLRRQMDGRWLMVIDNPHGQRLLQD